MALSREELINYAEKYINTEAADVIEADGNIIEFLLDNCEITVPLDNNFFVEINTDGIMNGIFWKRSLKYMDDVRAAGLADGQEALVYTGSCDFGHTTAHFESVVSLGIYGLRKRLDKYVEKYKTDEKKLRFYKNSVRVYDAVLRFMKRAATMAQKYGKNDMATGILNLTQNPPQTLFEAMQTIIIYYVVQHMIEGTNLRTLGRLDKLFYPFYVNEEKAAAERLIMDFMCEIDRLKAPSNIPFAICGTDKDGNSLINELSYVILKSYKKANTTNTKFHLLCSKNMPDDIINQAFEGVRDGSNSIVFMSDEKIIESLKKLGEEHENAVNYHVVGCYECGGEDELTSSCNGRVNLPKVVELTLNGGKDMLSEKQVGLQTDTDFKTYSEFFETFKIQLEYICTCAMKITDLYERNYAQIHSAPVLSATYTSSLEKGGDLYCNYAAKYNNSSVNAIGLATAVDSLASIKKLVFEDEMLTLTQFTEILKSNWQGKEELRLLIKNKFPKYGRGDEKTDEIAKNVVDILADAISGKPNVKGGVYRLGLFSINWRWELGKKTAASADGRLCGETLSQNASATFGADKDGATAHLTSVARLDSSRTPNGTIADIDLHISSVKGENGIKALTATLRTYFEMGGFGVHYNILDTNVLKAAKENPEKYPGLQVRLCGWNVLFSTLSDKEKEEFISRSVR